MLKLTRSDAHAVYGQRIMRDGIHVGYVGKDLDGNWAVKPVDGRVMIGRRTRKEALENFEATLVQADELAAQDAINIAAAEEKLAEPGTVERALQDAAAADTERLTDEEAARGAAAILEGIRQSEASQAPAGPRCTWCGAREDAELGTVESTPEGRLHKPCRASLVELEPFAQHLADVITGVAKAAPAGPQAPVQDLDWSDVEADGERAAATVSATLALELARPGRRVTLIRMSDDPSEASQVRTGTMISHGDEVLRFHDAQRGYVELVTDRWAVYPRLAAGQVASIVEECGWGVALAA